MSAADLVARLAQQGIDPELLAEVAQELFTGEMERKTLADRRQNERERKARSRDVTGQSVTSEAVTEQVSLDKEKSPRPPKEINPIPCVRATREGAYHRMPEGWQPTKAYPPQLQAKIDQWPPGAEPDQIACFKRWAANAPDVNGRGRKKDWDKALWNWLTRVHDERYSRKTAANDIGKSAAAFAMLSGDPNEPF